LGGSRQPSGTNVVSGVDVSVVAGLTTRAVPRPHRQLFAVQRKGIGGEPGSLLVVLRFEVGTSTPPVEEVLECLTEIAELLLERHRRDFPEPRLLFLE
jgi:hypothetical protein